MVHRRSHAFTPPLNLVGVSQGRKQQQVNQVKSLYVELVSELVCGAHDVMGHVMGFPPHQMNSAFFWFGIFPYSWHSNCTGEEGKHFV